MFAHGLPFGQALGDEHVAAGCDTALGEAMERDPLGPVRSPPRAAARLSKILAGRSIPRDDAQIAGQGSGSRAPARAPRSPVPIRDRRRRSALVHDDATFRGGDLLLGRPRLEHRSASQASAERCGLSALLIIPLFERDDPLRYEPVTSGLTIVERRDWPLARADVGGRARPGRRVVPCRWRRGANSRRWPALLSAASQTLGRSRPDVHRFTERRDGDHI